MELQQRFSDWSKLAQVATELQPIGSQATTGHTHDFSSGEWLCPTHRTSNPSQGKRLRPETDCIHPYVFLNWAVTFREFAVAKKLHFPLGPEMGLELVCGTDVRHNRHCAASRVRIRAPRGPRTGPGPPSSWFSVDLGVGGLGGVRFNKPG